LTNEVPLFWEIFREWKKINPVWSNWRPLLFAVSFLLLTTTNKKFTPVFHR
jgi:hypothetical protein